MDATPERPMVGNLVPDVVPQEHGVADEVLFAGVDGELPERVIHNLLDNVVEVYN